MEWIIYASFFFFIYIIAFLLFRYLEMRRVRIRKRVVEIENKEWQETEQTENRDSERKISNLIWSVLSHLKIIRMLDERLQNELKKANILMKSNELIVTIFLAGVLGSMIGIFIAGGEIGRGVWLGLFTWTGPLLWLSNKKKTRKSKLEKQLPELITMTSNSLKAGYSLLQSLELLSRELTAPLSQEIHRMLQEMRLGVTTEQALLNFNKRIESKDLDLIITAILIQRQVGGNLAEILEKIGKTIRERIKINGEMKSLTAQGRMSMIIFMVLPIGLAAFLLMTNPKYMMTLFTTPIGLGMIIIAVFGQLLGAVIIKRIIKIEV